jgi:hypothetical protein
MYRGHTHHPLWNVDREKTNKEGNYWYLSKGVELCMTYFLSLLQNVSIAMGSKCTNEHRCCDLFLQCLSGDVAEPSVTVMTLSSNRLGRHHMSVATVTIW